MERICYRIYVKLNHFKLEMKIIVNQPYFNKKKSVKSIMRGQDMENKIKVME